MGSKVRGQGQDNYIPVVTLYKTVHTLIKQQMFHENEMQNCYDFLLRPRFIKCKDINS